MQMSLQKLHQSTTVFFCNLISSLICLFDQSLAHIYKQEKASVRERFEFSKKEPFLMLVLEQSLFLSKRHRHLNLIYNI